MKVQYKYYNGEDECPFDKFDRVDSMNYYRFWFWVGEKQFSDQDDSINLNSYITLYCDYLEQRHGGEFDDCKIDMHKTYMSNSIVNK